MTNVFFFSERVLQDRIDAVEEILESTSESLVKLREIMRGLPDLAKGLCRIQYGKVRRWMLVFYFYFYLIMGHK